MTHNEQKALFLKQSYEDAWEAYVRALEGDDATWDYVVLTASNEAQAESYRLQLEARRRAGRLPGRTAYWVLPDPGGRRVGSGGATLGVLRALREKEASLAGLRILLIHSGGDSKRVPQYSVCGKLFSPIPRLLPSGYQSTLFDEFLISFAGMPGRMEDGLLALSGDVTLLLNPLQIDFYAMDAGVIAIPTDAETGARHGVFTGGPDGLVREYLHKLDVEALRARGAVDAEGDVHIDTGAVLLRSTVLEALSGLLCTGGAPDAGKAAAFISEGAALSLYADFLYPMARASREADYYGAPWDGRDAALVRRCRQALWTALRPFGLRMFSPAPSAFLHFGTTREVLALFARDVDGYAFLGWQAKTLYNEDNGARFACSGSYASPQADIAPDSYLEHARVEGCAVVGPGSVVACVRLADREVPGGVALHGARLGDGRYVARIYGVMDNPKQGCPDGAFLGRDLSAFADAVGREVLWPDGVPQTLWDARLYAPCPTLEAAVDAALALYRLVADAGGGDEGAASRRDAWLAAPRLSLRESFEAADAGWLLDWQEALLSDIRLGNYLGRVRARRGIPDADAALGAGGMTPAQRERLLSMAGEARDGGYRLCFYLAGSRHIADRQDRKRLSALGYDAICRQTWQGAAAIRYRTELRIAQPGASVALPVRVNWGGGWSDTPPYCHENGGTVLNAAIRLGEGLPIHVDMAALPVGQVVLTSADAGISKAFDSLDALCDFDGPFDPFSLQKAVLIACGVLPRPGQAAGETLPGILARMGGGFSLTARVDGIPRGSGLGTSSILAGACVRAVHDFFGEPLTDGEAYAHVLNVEQLMSTGGGWQDQIGGMTPGIKLITTRPGSPQRFDVSPVRVPEAALAELQARFVLIDSGQRRLARNLLRSIMGRYIVSEPEAVDALARIQRVAALMRYELERGDITAFAGLLDAHWDLSRQLDAGSTNTCIEQIFASCDDLLAGRMICGAGGGGFLQGVLRRGATREDLRARLREVFRDSGVNLRESYFV